MMRCLRSPLLVLHASMLCLEEVNGQVTVSLQGGLGVAGHESLEGQGRSQKGLQVLGGAALPISAGLSGQLGLGYIQEGGIEDDVGASSMLTLGVHYLEVPALLRFTIPGERFSPHFLAGATFAWKVACEYTATGYFLGIAAADYCGSAHVGSTNTSVLAGIGVDAHTSGRMSITFDAQHRFGLPSHGFFGRRTADRVNDCA